jgi:hypothetical protein
LISSDSTNSSFTARHFSALSRMPLPANCHAQSVRHTNGQRAFSVGKHGGNPSKSRQQQFLLGRLLRLIMVIRGTAAQAGF